MTQTWAAALPAKLQVTPAAATRIASLDGIRAFSIALVLFGHALGTANFLPLSVTRGFLDPGRLGVRIFFVISGFLITSLLLNERARSGGISLSSFYIRRAYRILPASLVFLGTMAFLAAAGVLELPKYNLLYAVTYTLNLTSSDQTWWTGHLWSLAVEEQFYLLWPAAVAFFSHRSAVRIAVAALVIPPVLRALVVAGSLPPLEQLGNSFPVVADDLAWGCLAALLRPHWQTDRVQRLFRARWFYLLFPGIFVLSALAYRPRLCPQPMFQLLVNPAIGFFIAAMVVRFTGVYEDRPGRILNSPLMVRVGILSYSLYLWQQPFLNRQAHSVLQSFPVNLLCAFALAAVSYYFIEEPFLRLSRKRREAAARSPRHPLIPPASATVR